MQAPSANMYQNPRLPEESQGFSINALFAWMVCMNSEPPSGENDANLPEMQVPRCQPSEGRFCKQTFLRVAASGLLG